jgi:hypothetical protein
MAKHHQDLIMCRKQPGIAIGRLCERCTCSFEYVCVLHGINISLYAQVMAAALFVIVLSNLRRL